MTQKHYPELDANPNFAAVEEGILAFWKANQIFEQSVKNRAEKKPDGSSNAYVFYDGPPFANGLPHYGHLLTGYVKDAIARYHTMRGARVERRFGWDCHGLPAEMGAEKELGIAGRLAILDYGIGKFNDYCRSSVMKYTREWEYYVTRQGRWVDFANDYKTMDKNFMESVIWAFSELYKKDLVFEAYRVMPYSWAAESTLSNFEIRMDNATREREDKAAYVKFKLKSAPAGAPLVKNHFLVAWTTTPWTLPSNLALAVSSSMEYGCLIQGEDCIIASMQALKILAPQLGVKDEKELQNVKIIHGADLEQKSYEPLFPYFADTKNAFRIIDGGDAVTEGEGTGVIHMAPGFGEVDQKVCAANGIEVVVPVDAQGKFTDEIYDIPWHPPESATPLRNHLSGDFDPPLAGDSAGSEAGLPPPAGGRSNPPLKRIWEGVGTHPDSTRLPHTMQHAEELRANQTEAEKKLWAVLSNKKLGDKKFRRQHAIGSYIVDFVCVNASLVIELDGGQHADQVEYDAARTEYLKSQHYRVLRFWNNDVLQNLEGVVAEIEEALAHPPKIEGDFDLPLAGGGSPASPQVLRLQGLVVVPDTRIAEANIQMSDEDKAKHISAKDVAKYGLANMRIVRWLKAHGKLVKDEPYKHNYPHCYRTDTPIIYRAMSSWYVAVTKFRDRAVELNQQIHWVPEHVKNGQMGHMLATAPDWSISRNRFWGTPIPIWRSPSGKMIVPGSIAEIEKLSGKKVEDLHRPFIDSITFERDGETYTRIEDVFDCWFESGSMPFAQLHYPFENKQTFEACFPADFITEYVGQTRGWFNTLIMLSTALFDKPPFRNVICHGVVIDEETGLKYSKRLKNYRDPKEVMEQFGADALRWMMLASPVMRGADIGVDPDGKFIRDVVRLNIKPLWSAYNFFTLYANADGVKAKEVVSRQSPVVSKEVSSLTTHDSRLTTNLLDRYILAKCRAAIEQVRDSLDAYDTPGATDAITAFFDVLNNWYIRRSRPRFWAEIKDADPSSQSFDEASKQAAYDTLFTVLSLMCRASAPLLPFTTEAVYRGLHGDAASVHLTDFPDVSGMDSAKEQVAEMDWVRDVCNAGSAVRNKQNIRNRQPLASITLAGGKHPSEWLTTIICDELNVKKCISGGTFDDYASVKLQINSQVLGKRLPAKMKEILPASKKGEWKREGGEVVIAGEKLLPSEYTILLEPKPAYANSAAPLSTNDALVILDLTLTPELEAEGRARDLVRMIQQARKDAGLHVADRINLALDVPPEFEAALATHGDYIREQTLAVSYKKGSANADQRITQELDGAQFTIGLSKVA